MAVSAIHNGWQYDPANSRLNFYYRGTRVGDITATGFNTTQALAVTGAITATTSIAATTTMTAGTGFTCTTGNIVNTAGDNRITAGNLRLGAVSTFATTQPTSAVVMKVGTAPVGAITTSVGLYTEGTVVKKIIADGTASNVET